MTMPIGSCNKGRPGQVAISQGNEPKNPHVPDHAQGALFCIFDDAGAAADGV